MGFISGIIDAVVVLFSAVLAVAIPVIDAQSLFPELYPPVLVDLKRWYREQYGDYLMGEMPHFFVGLVWVEIALLWPLSLANIYGIATRRPWAGTTSLIAGVSAGTSMGIGCGVVHTITWNYDGLILSHRQPQQSGADGDEL